VAVLDGALTGTAKVTDAAGRVELRTKTEPSLTVRVSRDGFHTKTEILSGQSSDGVARFYLWLDSFEPTLGLEPGAYTLTIAIDLTTATTWMAQAPCAGFPVELASRRYRALSNEVRTQEQLLARAAREDRRLPLVLVGPRHDGLHQALTANP
jgi:hypothetical protein